MFAKPKMESGRMLCQRGRASGPPPFLLSLISQLPVFFDCQFYLFPHQDPSTPRHILMQLFFQKLYPGKPVQTHCDKDADSMYLCRMGVWMRRNSTVRYEKVKVVKKISMEITVLGKSKWPLQSSVVSDVKCSQRRVKSPCNR